MGSSSGGSGGGGGYSGNGGSGTNGSKSAAQAAAAQAAAAATAFGSPGNPSNVGYSSNGVSYQGTPSLAPSGSASPNGGTGFWGGVGNVAKKAFDSTIYGKAYNVIADAAAKNPNTGNFYSTTDHSDSPYYQGGDSTSNWFQSTNSANPNSGSINSSSGNASATNTGSGSGYTPIIPYQQSDDYTNSLNKIGQMISQNSTKPYLDLGTNYVTNALSDNYSAYTPEQQQQMIADQTKLYREQAKIDENRIGSRLANSGLAGSGVSAMDWGGQDAREKNAISDIVSNIGNQNISATRSDRSQALGTLPTLSSMSQTPLQNQMSYTNLLGQNDASKNAWNQWSEEVNRGVTQTNQANDRYNQQQNQQNMAQAANMALQLMSK